MRKAVMAASGTILIENKTVPIIGDNEVLIKVMRIGICGSDIHVYHGKHPYTAYPLVQGHEVSAVETPCGDEA